MSVMILMARYLFSNLFGTGLALQPKVVNV